VELETIRSIIVGCWLRERTHAWRKKTRAGQARVHGGGGDSIRGENLFSDSRGDSPSHPGSGSDDPGLGGSFVRRDERSSCKSPRGGITRVRFAECCSGNTRPTNSGCHQYRLGSSPKPLLCSGPYLPYFDAGAEAGTFLYSKLRAKSANIPTINRNTLYRKVL